jgi:uncharacterized protein YecT (DUF1311 family)
MRKLISLVILLLPLSSFADACISAGNVYDDLSCAKHTLEQLKRELNAIYQKIYSSTQYKNEFEQSQKVWLNYRERPCNGYIAAEASQSQGAAAHGGTIFWKFNQEYRDVTKAKEYK